MNFFKYGNLMSDRKTQSEKKLKVNRKNLFRKTEKIIGENEFQKNYKIKENEDEETILRNT